MTNEIPQNTGLGFQASDTGILRLIGKNLGDYHIVRVLAKGGMGIIYEAEQISLNRKVAIKILPNEIINEFISLERFRMEAQAVANLHHPNIVQVYQFAEWQNTHFFAMEFIEGKTLEEILHIKRNSEELQKSIPLQWALDIIIQVLKALEFAHSKNVVHRDIKPANIMLDVSGRVFLTDFGLAKCLDLDKLEGEGLTIGTPEYMSPEQAAGEAVDWRTDIYALGLVLYEMLTGDTPYQGKTPMSIIANRIIKQPVRRPTEFNPEIPAEIERIILRSVAQQRSERFQSAQEMLSALEKFRSEQKISEIVRSATAKEKARAKAEIEKEKEKAQAAIIEEKMKSSLILAEEQKHVKRKELLKLMKISVKVGMFLTVVYLMLFLIYETNMEEDRIKKEVARQVSVENMQAKTESQSIETSNKSSDTGLAIPQTLVVTESKTEKSKVQTTASSQDTTKDGLTQNDIDWIQTQFQLGKNYEFVHRKDLAVESYMKIIRKYPGTSYAQRARKHIRSLADQNNN